MLPFSGSLSSVLLRSDSKRSINIQSSVIIFPNEEICPPSIRSALQHISISLSSKKLLSNATVIASMASSIQMLEHCVSVCKIRTLVSSKPDEKLILENLETVGT